LGSPSPNRRYSDFLPEYVHFYLKINIVHKPTFFNISGKKGSKVVKSGKYLHIFAKIFIFK